MDVPDDVLRGLGTFLFTVTAFLTGQFIWFLISRGRLPRPVSAAVAEMLRHRILLGIYVVVAIAAGLFGYFGLGPLANGRDEPTPSIEASAAAGPTVEPSPSAGCPSADAVVWTGLEGKPGGEEQWSLDHVSQHVDACMTLMVSSTTMDVPGGEACDGSGDAEALCVAVWEAGDRGIIAENSGLWPGSTWWGLTRASAERAISDKQLDPELGWFSDANCSGRGGCSVVHVYHFSLDAPPWLEEVTPAPAN